jgi:predicted Zn-dependent peptidase
MVVKTIILICILLFSLFPKINGAFKINAYRLPNGLTVILSPDENIQATCVMSYHLTGVRDDSPEIKGASYLYQYLMFQGTENLDPYDRIMFAKRNGGTSSGRVNYDNSVFFQVIPDHQLNNAIWMESERIKSLKITDQVINHQKNTVFRRQSRLESSNVSFRAKNWVRSKVFEGTSYEKPLYGDLVKLRSFDNRKIKSIYDNYRDLTDLILVICGRFDELKVNQLIKKHFSHPFPKSRNKQRNYSVSKPREKYIYKNWLIENLANNFVIYGIRAPARLSYNRILFDFVKYYLIDERISHLEKLMNGINRLDVNITYEYTDHIESNAFIIKIASPKRINVEKAKYIMENVLTFLQKNPLSNSKLRMVKSLMEIDFLKSLAIIEKRSILLAENYYLFGDLKFQDSTTKRIRKISQYDIMEICKKYLSKKNLVILNVYKK